MLAQIVQNQREQRFAGIRGAILTGRLPVREALFEPLCRDAVANSNGRLQSLQVRIIEGNVLIVNAKVAVLFFRKLITLHLRIDPVVEYSVNPVMNIHIVDSGGIPGFVLEFLLTLLPFPESITILPKLVAINLKTALTRRKLDEFVPLIKRLSLETERGCGYIGFAIAVD